MVSLPRCPVDCKKFAASRFYKIVLTAQPVLAVPGTPVQVAAPSCITGDGTGSPGTVDVLPIPTSNPVSPLLKVGVLQGPSGNLSGFVDRGSNPLSPS